MQLRTTIITVFISALVGFTGYRFLPLIQGVSFNITSESPTIATVPLFTLSGSVPRASVLSVNGHIVNLSRTNQFTDTVLLMPGYNVITMNAEDKFGKGQEHIVRVYYQPQDRVAMNTTTTQSEQNY